MLFIDAPLRMAVRAVKGGRGEPFIGAQRRPLTEEAGGAGACFAAEEQLSFVKSFLPIGGCWACEGTPCHGGWQGVSIFGDRKVHAV